jgi:hypothetical protein
MKSLSSLLAASLLSLLSLTSVGCTTSTPSRPVTMADSFDLDLFGPHVDDLHTPYVAGASFAITVSASSSQSQAGWSLSSSDPAVFRVESALSGGSANVTAVAPGQATLNVLNASGEVMDSHPISVAIPDQVNLYAEGLLVTGASDSAAQITQASIVAGGQATFLVRYFLQGTELYGSGALQTTTTTGLTAATVSETFATARDFLQVSTPETVGATGSVSLVIDNVVVGQVPITDVAASAVTQVSILQQSAAGVQNGTQLTLYAHAVDSTAADVYGASFNWSTNTNGNAQSAQNQESDSDAGIVWGGGPADLFFYDYESGSSETVTASYDGFSPSVVVHGQGGSVGSTANVACAVGVAPGSGGGGASWPALGALVFAGVAFAKRRRCPRLV